MGLGPEPRDRDDCDWNAWRRGTVAEKRQDRASLNEWGRRLCRGITSRRRLQGVGSGSGSGSGTLHLHLPAHAAGCRAGLGSIAGLTAPLTEYRTRARPTDPWVQTTQQHCQSRNTAQGQGQGQGRLLLDDAQNPADRTPPPAETRHIETMQRSTAR